MTRYKTASEEAEQSVDELKQDKRRIQKEVNWMSKLRDSCTAGHVCVFQKNFQCLLARKC